MIATQGCAQHEPNLETLLRDKDGSPAEILNFADYPIAAACKLCNARIISHSMAGAWEEYPERGKVNGDE